VDPDRVCIMGASYGGYSALAGGAFSPELYRCVISIAGVSDLPQMISKTKSQNKSYSPIVKYWQRLIGDSETEKQKLKSISPVNFAENFRAPVLLVHGKDDLVVSIRQSKSMLSALKKAGKNVKMVTLKGEDHWLSNSETRLELLESVDKFLQKHNPVSTL
jgi:dipeptidyl aminopeptidase/acylaminoacyl peptidase